MNNRLKKCFALVLCFFIMLGVAPLNFNPVANAVDVIVWSGAVSSEFAGGTGEANNPYQITTAEQLALFASAVNNHSKNGGDVYYADCYYELINNIYINNTDNIDSWGKNAPSNSWTAIGTQSNAFDGVFNGNGNKIYGIYISNSDDYQGLFGNSVGVVKNIGIEKSYISGGSNIGAVVGSGYASNCYNTGTVIASGDNIGGVVGNGSAINCYNTGAVTGYESNVGGVVGNGKTVICCYNVGAIIGYEDNVGGVVGDGSAINSYYLDDSIKVSFDNSVSLTDDEMKSADNFDGFDFNNVWTIDTVTSYAYPQLVVSLNESLSENSAVWSGETANNFDGGDGTESNPYIISSANQLGLMAKLINENRKNTSDVYYSACCYKLANDITFNDVSKKYWTLSAIEFSSINGFSGTFDGDGYSIRGLYIDSVSSYQGLFGKLSGSVKNVSLANYFVSGIDFVGGLVGCAESGSSIDNCTVHGSVIGIDNVGGVAGYAYEANECSSISSVIGGSKVGGCVGEGITINSCYNAGNVSASNYVGGIVGYAQTVTDSVNSGLINGNLFVGGVVGYSTGSVSGCCNTGNVNAGSFVGGIVGEGNAVSSCLNDGSITAGSYVGGLAGHITTMTDCFNSGDVTGGGFVGGALGYTNASSVTNCINTGTVSGVTDTGSVVGISKNNSTITNCYYVTTSATGCDGDSLATALTAEQINDISSFVGFDFSETSAWEWDETEQKPVIKGSDPIYTVIFVDECEGCESAIIKEQLVKEGNSATAPNTDSLTKVVDNYQYTFKQWGVSFDNITADTVVKTVYDKTEIVTYKAVFKADGKIISEVSYNNYTTSITEPTVPEKAGYTGAWESYSLDIGGVTINAVYTANTYVATLMADGKKVTEIEYTYGQKSIDLPNVPKKDGYTGAWESYSLDIGGVTINAVYTANTYVATLMADGKKVTEIEYTYGQKSIDLPNVPKKDGYTGAWESYSLDIGGVTINAVYTANTYVATLMADGKKVTEIEYTYGQKSIELPNVPKKDGYTGAWESYSLDIGGVTINAVYTANTYVATLMADGKKVTEIEYTYGQKSIDLPNVPKKDGYTGEWESYSLDIGGVTINAVYTPIVYTVKFVADGKLIDKKTFTVENMSFEIPEVPQKEKYSGVWSDYQFAYADFTIYAVYTCTDKIEIKNYRDNHTKILNYSTTITFYTDISKRPDGAIIKWIVDYENGKTEEIYSNKLTLKNVKKSFDLHFEMYDGNGNLIGMSNPEKVTVKHSFFDRLVSLIERFLGIGYYEIEQ